MLFRNEPELLTGRNREVRRKVLSLLEAGVRSVDPRASVLENLSLRGSVLRVGPAGGAGDLGGEAGEVLGPAGGQGFAPGQGGVNKAGASEVELDRNSRIIVIGCGKAATAMVQAVHEALGDRAEGFVNGIESRTIGRISILKASHPIPDEEGERGAERILELARSATERDVVVCLISGGGSALMPLPEEGISLKDKIATTRLLLKCGADIVEINTVRKHLSRIKGGKLALAAGRARVFSLVLSDVLGDPLDSIASGPTAPDTGTYEDAIRVLRKYAIWNDTPESVRRVLEARAHETPKADHPVFRRVRNIIIGNNEKAVDAAAAQARELGYCVATRHRWSVGEAREFPGRLLFPEMRGLLDGRELMRPAALVFGGELTVTLRGRGRGGRNQEMVLAALEGLERGALPLALGEGGGGRSGARGDARQNWVLASLGTDGIDGNSDAAGALADAEVVERARGLGLRAGPFLEDNDSSSFFERAGGLLLTGPTGTNVADIGVLIVE
ncbi:MAG: glycerate kinase type-2 family protein [Thermoplasmatota archaeon]